MSFLFFKTYCTSTIKKEISLKKSFSGSPLLLGEFEFIVSFKTFHDH